MQYIIIGLGNPGEKYESTRHNAGRLVTGLLEAGGQTKKIKFYILDEYMNNSGRAVIKLIKSKKQIANLIIIHDDLDLALGTFKVSFNKGPGGHRGVTSVIKALKSQEFTRIRVGISPVTPSGKLKKPSGEKAVLDFILGKFKTKELEILKKLCKKIGEAVELIKKEGVQLAMNQFN